MVNHIKYKGKFWKIVSNRNGRYYLIPKKMESKFKKKFRSYKNIQKFGYSKNFRQVVRNQKKRNMLKGGAVEPPNPRETFVFDYNKNVVPMQAKNQYVTKDDKKWIDQLGNPRDQKIANSALSELNSINGLLNYFGGDSQKFTTLGDAVQYLRSNKDQVLQRVFENPSKLRNFGQNLGNVLKGVGLKIANFVGIPFGPENEWDMSSESIEKAGRALDEIVNDLKSKAISNKQTLQQLYLKQGDREEAKSIRDEEEQKQNKIRKEDRMTSTPKYQIIRNLNPLGYGVSESRVNVDPENLQQVRDVRQNPVLKRIDPNYFGKSSRPPPVTPKNSNVNPFQNREQIQDPRKAQSSWQ